MNEKSTTGKIQLLLIGELLSVWRKKLARLTDGIMEAL